MFLGVSYAPSQGVGPSVPQILGPLPSAYAHTIWPRASTFGMVTYVGNEGVPVVGQPRPPN